MLSAPVESAEPALAGAADSVLEDNTEGLVRPVVELPTPPSAEVEVEVEVEAAAAPERTQAEWNDAEVAALEAERERLVAQMRGRSAGPVVEGEREKEGGAVVEGAAPPAPAQPLAEAAEAEDELQVRLRRWSVSRTQGGRDVGHLLLLGSFCFSPTANANLLRSSTRLQLTHPLARG
jgi:hypothetical protein